MSYQHASLNSKRAQHREQFRETAALENEESKSQPVQLGPVGLDRAASAADQSVSLAEARVVASTPMSHGSEESVVIAATRGLADQHASSVADLHSKRAQHREQFREMAAQAEARRKAEEEEVEVEGEEEEEEAAAAKSAIESKVEDKRSAHARKFRASLGGKDLSSPTPDEAMLLKDLDIQSPSKVGSPVRLAPIGLRRASSAAKLGATLAEIRSTTRSAIDAAMSPSVVAVAESGPAKPMASSVANLHTKRAEHREQFQRTAALEAKARTEAKVEDTRLSHSKRFRGSH